MGWFEIDEPAVDQKTLVDGQIAHFLTETAPMVAMDNTSMTKSEMQAWIEYRKKLHEIPMQPDYPHQVSWPTRPE